MIKRSLFFVILLLFLTGCSHVYAPAIEEYNWVMTSIQSTKANGQILIYGKYEGPIPDNIEQIDLICQAKNGNLKLIDQTNSETHMGTYQLSEMSFQSAYYKVIIDGTQGIAVAAITSYHDGKQTPTLIFNFDERTFNFFAE